MNSKRGYFSQRGFVLVLVLWFLTLISMIALHLSQLSRSDAQLSLNLSQAAQMQFTNDAGISWALWNLTRPPESRWLADGNEQQIELDSAQVTVALQDEYGKFDVNQIDALQLSNLLVSLGVSYEQSAQLADTILDWRDEDSFRRLNGAEEQDYLLQGLDYLPANAPFKSIGELRRVLGMAEWIYQRMRPAVTVYAGRTVINPLVAPREVLMAYPNSDDAVVDVYIRDRRANHRAGLPPPPPPAFIDDPLPVQFQGVFYTIAVRSESQDKQSQEEAIVRRRGGVQGRYELISFQVPATFFACEQTVDAPADRCG